jgi:hypothetical protein
MLGEDWRSPALAHSEPAFHSEISRNQVGFDPRIKQTPRCRYAPSIVSVYSLASEK